MCPFVPTKLMPATTFETANTVVVSSDVWRARAVDAEEVGGTLMTVTVTWSLPSLPAGSVAELRKT